MTREFGDSPFFSDLICQWHNEARDHGHPVIGNGRRHEGCTVGIQLGKLGRRWRKLRWW
jgi:hypothetical protein